MGNQSPRAQENEERKSEVHESSQSEVAARDEVVGAEQVAKVEKASSKIE